MKHVRFEREARLLASLNHPGIAHGYGFGTVTSDDGTKVPVTTDARYYLMRYRRGVSSLAVVDGVR